MNYRRKVSNEARKRDSASVNDFEAARKALEVATAASRKADPSQIGDIALRRFDLPLQTDAEASVQPKTLFDQDKDEEPVVKLAASNGELIDSTMPNTRDSISEGELRATNAYRSFTR